MHPVAPDFEAGGQFFLSSFPVVEGITKSSFVRFLRSAAQRVPAARQARASSSPVVFGIRSFIVLSFGPLSPRPSVYHSPLEIVKPSITREPMGRIEQL
jgi:hypothetical protein